LDDSIIGLIRKHTYELARELKVKGLINIQFAVKGDKIYVLEVNPRASRTVPFVSKAIGVPLAKVAAKVMAGKTLAEAGFSAEKKISHIAVKESVLPFSRFSGVDILLGPEMKSTGEVMGIDSSFGKAFYKSQLAANQNLPYKGKIFISVKNSDKRDIVFIAKKLLDMRFEIMATPGTHKALTSNNIKTKPIGKINEGDRRILDLIKSRELKLIINTPSGPRGQSDSNPIRSMAVLYGVPCITTIQGAQAAVNGMEAASKTSLKVKPIQEFHRKEIQQKQKKDGDLI
jgi:carbamoyl-phosphate synthase large subunit